MHSHHMNWALVLGAPLLLATGRSLSVVGIHKSKATALETRLVFSSWILPFSGTFSSTRCRIRLASFEFLFFTIFTLSITLPRSA